MLGKLLKYELGATARIFLPLYGALIVVSMANNLLMRLQLDSLTIVGFLALFGLMVATAVLTIVILIERFYSNLLGSEGYLMFTLPVGVGSLVASKLIVSLIWIFCGLLTGAASGAILFLSDLMRAFKSQPFVDQVRSFAELLEGFLGARPDFWVLALAAAAVIMSAVALVLTIYASLSVGQLPVFHRFRIAASFVAFFVINTAFSAVGTPVFDALISSHPESGSIVISGLWVMLAESSARTALMYLITYFILKRRLNLE